MTKRTKKISNASKIRQNINSAIAESKIHKQRPKCYICDKTNHTLTECNKRKFCFKCGSKDHLNCDAKTYVCFHCHKLGHLSKDCELNPNGIYKHGGSCHICESKKHLSRDCDQRNGGQERGPPPSAKVVKKKVVTF